MEPDPVSRALCLYQCGEEFCASGHSFGPAVRDHYLLHCVFEGSGTFRRGGDTFSPQAGECFLIRPGEVCRYTADRETPWHYGWVGVGGEDAAVFLRLCGLTREQPVLPLRDPVGVLQALRALITCFAGGRNSFASLAALYTLLDRLCDNRPLSVSENTFDRVADCLRRNYSYPLTVQQLADRVNLDRSQLYRVVKQQTGQSPQDYITSYRLQESLRLMNNTALTLTEILCSVGFESLPQFSRCFKRVYGVSPRQYRERLAEGKLYYCE